MDSSPTSSDRPDASLAGRSDAGASRSREAGRAEPAPHAAGFAVVEIAPADVPPPGGYVDLALEAGPAEPPAGRPDGAPAEDERARAREAARASAIAALVPPRRGRITLQALLAACGFAALAAAEIAYVARAAPRRAPEPVFAVAHGAPPAPASEAAHERRRRVASRAPRTAAVAPAAATPAPAPGSACPVPQEPTVEWGGTGSTALAAAGPTQERLETAAIRTAAALAAPDVAAPTELAGLAGAAPARDPSAPGAPAAGAPAAERAAGAASLPAVAAPVDPPAVASASAH